MKKIYSILTLSFFILMSISIFSCDKDKDTEPDVNHCAELGEAYVEALTAYINDLSNSEKCEIFLQAAQDYINGCDLLTPVQKAEILEQIDEADCSK